MTNFSGTINPDSMAYITPSPLRTGAVTAEAVTADACDGCERDCAWELLGAAVHDEEVEDMICAVLF